MVFKIVFKMKIDDTSKCIKIFGSHWQLTCRFIPSPFILCPRHHFQPIKGLPFSALMINGFGLMISAFVFLFENRLGISRLIMKMSNKIGMCFKKIINLKSFTTPMASFLFICCVGDFSSTTTFWQASCPTICKKPGEFNSLPHSNRMGRRTKNRYQGMG